MAWQRASKSLLCQQSRSVREGPRGPAHSPLKCPFPLRSVPSCSCPSPASGRKIHTQSGSASGSLPSFFLYCRPRPPPHPGPPSGHHHSHSPLNDEVTAFAVPLREYKYQASTSHFIVQTAAPLDACMNPSPYFITQLSALFSHQRRRITLSKKMRHPAHTAQAWLPPPRCCVAPPLLPPPVSRRRGALRVLQFWGARACALAPQVGLHFPGSFEV